MSDAHTISYIPGERPSENKPLGRFLPPTRKSVASTWLEDHIPKGSWLLDPFGAAPDLVVEVAQSGYRVLVAANNPVTRFLLEMRANPFPRSEYQAAIASLASSHVGSERLEPHIKSQYATSCAECHSTVMAKAFLWKRESTTPYARIYDCPQCGDSGERPATTSDIALAAQFAVNSLHRARALERVAPLNDPDRVHAEEAIEVYLPRAVYVLATLINKLSGASPLHRQLLAALLLATFDQANTLWPHPVERQRPRQLTIPPQFRENNIWQALESAADLWASSDTPIPLTRWPAPPPPQGGICLFEGRIKDLAENLSQIDLRAVLTTFPRPNQAFWTLSALWSGWLWGYEAVEHFKSVLRRRRYDWGWHTTAIHAALDSLVTKLPEKTPIFGLINEAEPGFLSAAVLGAQHTRLDLQGIALRTNDGQAQITWESHLKETKTSENSKDIETIICEAGRAYLRQRGEPSPYLYLHAAGLAELAQNPTIGKDQTPGESLSQVQAVFQHVLSYRNGFLRFERSAKSLEVGQWWIREHDESVLPLADRVEMGLVKYLLKNPGCTISEIDSSLCKAFPGLTPPEIELIQVCLESYGEQSPPKSGRWSIREQDSPSKRRADLAEMAHLLLDLGVHLGFEVVKEGEIPPAVQWVNVDDQIQYGFYLSASAVLGKFIFTPQFSPAKSLIVLPGSRSNLVAFKLKCNAYAQQIVEQGWRFIKYRHLRQLAESPTLNSENLDEQFSLDPLTYTKPQMRLF